jgi:hypothetical protein
VSTSCLYCRSKLVDTERATVAVDRIAPFRLSHRAAQDRLRAHVGGSVWAPTELRRHARPGARRPKGPAPELFLQGALVPFYAFSATVKSRYRAQVGVLWNRTETRKGKDGEPQTHVVQETEWFTLRGSTADELEDHLVAASVGLSQKESRALMPFDLGRAKPFDPRLLAGWHAELPTRPRHEVDRAARQSIHDHEERVVLGLVPGDRRRLDHFEADIQIHRVHLVLLPVWIATFRHGDKLVRLLVNGQTGRCIGRAPISWAKVTAGIVVGTVALLVILWLTGAFRWM